MSWEIIVGLISAIIPTLTTAIMTVRQNRAQERHAAKQSILQMILEDHVAWDENRLPDNYQNVLHEYDIYHEDGGNSYVTDKVVEYKDWYKSVQAKAKKAAKVAKSRK